MNKKLIIVLVLVGLAVTIGLLLYFTPRGKVQIVLSPESVTLKIDDQKELPVQNGQEFTLNTGVYVLQASREGFSTETSRIEVKNGETTKVAIALTPLTDEAKKATSEKLTAEALAAKNAQFFAQLPFKSSNYSIEACQSVKYPNDTTKKALCISELTPGARSLALAYVKNAGYKPDDFELLIGTQQKKTVISSANYIIEYFSSVESPKMPIYITTLHTDDNESKLAARDEALRDFAASGYDINQYDIYYSDTFLSQYNTAQLEPEEHASAPVE